MKRIKLFFAVSLLIITVTSISQLNAQEIDAAYINPTLGGDGSVYKFLRIGNNSSFWGGLMWNNTLIDYGDGDDLSLFTYNNRDLTFRTGTGNVIFFPSSGGNVGIGTTSPREKLDINGYMILGSQTNNIVKSSYIIGSQFNNVDEPEGYYLIGGWADADNNVVSIGGSSSGYNASNLIRFYTASNTSSKTGTERMRITKDGNIGIGTTNPSEKLEVAGGVKITGKNQTNSISGFANVLQLNAAYGHAAITYNSGQPGELMFGFHNNGNFYWGCVANSNYPMYLNGSTGDLGITGKLTSDEVEVKLGGWPDFVFAPTYKLPTLKEVENYINENNHLPDVPSEKEVIENGINLGEMDATLLQKIEELTLYTIEQQKQLEQQSKMLLVLKKELDELKTKK